MKFKTMTALNFCDLNRQTLTARHRRPRNEILYSSKKKKRKLYDNIRVYTRFDRKRVNVIPLR